MTSNDVIPYTQLPHEHTWQTLLEFTLPREPGNQRTAVDRVAEAVHRLNWSAAHLEQLKLALAQATRKATESSSQYNPEGVLVIRVLIPENEPANWEVDRANDEPTPRQVADRQVRQVNRPPARGWSFFLIEQAVPDSDGAERHLLELFLYPGGK